ncbi:hypothetical protein HKD24_10080 [Gluconobacter sp. LMG 31484]|uniref:DUF4433 domain-containing protein n=1 Tax=Gluconobacter vitians TaxID=2728102 RepID=A0ABR9Y6V9_9PROT|nr:hypothetical protein [Gluconobacter vitians]MBF0859565.1 hypothetical protein [Gluconobacter vitians]
MGRRRSPSSASLFEHLPKSRRERPETAPTRRPAAPPEQPDLLGWTPPPTHLPAADVEASFLNPVGFRPPAGEAFVYHLTDVTTARNFVRDGLPLADGLMFRTAAHLAEDLAHVSAVDDMGVVRVRRRLIHPWLTEDRQDGRPCYVLGPEPS